MSPTQKQTGEYLNKLRNVVKVYGWAIQWVLPTAGEPGPGFSHTVGLSLQGHSEIILSGLPPQTSQTLLNMLAERVRETGEDLPVNELLHDVIRGFPVILIPVTNPSQYVTTANALLREQVKGARADAVQMVWPDKHGAFPWEPESTWTPGQQEVYGPAPETTP